MRLIVDCCAREQGATKKLLDAFLKLDGEKPQTYLSLYKQSLTPFNAEMCEERSALIEKGDFSGKYFKYAKEFSVADEIVIAAPYWDLSFPSLLKVYLENVSVNNLTFGYSEKGELVGLCKAKRLVYLSTAGGVVQRHLGEEYVFALANMFGIKKVYGYCIDRLDINPSCREALVQNGIKELEKFIKRI